MIKHRVHSLDNDGGNGELPYDRGIGWLGRVYDALHSSKMRWTVIEIRQQRTYKELLLDIIIISSYESSRSILSILVPHEC